MWVIGDGRCVHAWNDVWLGEGLRLVDEVQHIPAELERWRVCDMVGADGHWKFDELRAVLPTSIVQRLLAIVPLAEANGRDRCLWPGNKLGQFSVSTALRVVIWLPFVWWAWQVGKSLEIGHHGEGPRVCLVGSPS